MSVSEEIEIENLITKPASMMRDDEMLVVLEEALNIAWELDRAFADPVEDDKLLEEIDENEDLFIVSELILSKLAEIVEAEYGAEEIEYAIVKKAIEIINRLEDKYDEEIVDCRFLRRLAKHTDVIRLSEVALERLIQFIRE